jgi:hypothetical protein
VPGSHYDYLWKRASFRLAAAALALLGVCGGIEAWQAFEGGASGGLMAATTVEEALKNNVDRLMSLPGVVGAAVGECGGKPCIRLLVVRKTAELMQKIPAMLEGYPVVVEETGPIGPMDRG